MTTRSTMYLFTLPFYIMAAWIPFTFGQSTIPATRPATTTGLVPATSVVASVAASRLSTTAVATSSAAAARPSLVFDTVDTLTACGTTQYVLSKLE
jgi:hypothetical protein